MSLPPYLFLIAPAFTSPYWQRLPVETRIDYARKRYCFGYR